MKGLIVIAVSIIIICITYTAARGFTSYSRQNNTSSVPEGTLVCLGQDDAINARDSRMKDYLLIEKRCHTLPKEFPVTVLERHCDLAEACKVRIWNPSDSSKFQDLYIREEDL